MNIPPPSKHQVRLFWAALSGLSVGALAGLLYLLIWGLSCVLDVLSPVLWPLAVAGVIAYLLDPIVDFCEHKGLSRPRAIIGVFAIALVIVAALLANVVPTILTQSREFKANLPKITKKVEGLVEQWTGNPPGLFSRVFNLHPLVPQKQSTAISATNGTVVVQTTNQPPVEIGTNAPALPANGNGPMISESTLQSAAGWLGRLLPRAGSVVVSWLGVLVGLALVPIYAFYLLVEKQGIQSKWTNYLPLKDSKFKSELVFILQSINDYLIAFFRGQVLVSICDGIMYGVGFLIIGLPYAVLLGAAAIVLTIIPFIGAIIIFIAALIIALVQYGDWKHPLLVVVVFVTVQMLESVVVSPRIMKGRVGLHPLTIIIAVMVGTSLLGGVLGGVLAIPLTAVMRVLLARYVWNRQSPKENS